MGRRERVDPSEWSLREAVERYLTHRRADATEASIKSWYYDLKLFVEWIEAEGVDVIGAVEPYDLADWYDVRAGTVAPSTLYNEMHALTSFFRFLRRKGATTDEHLTSIHIPDIDPAEMTDSTSLRPDAGLDLIEFYRDSPNHRGTRGHVYLELAWFIGARLGGLRALDVYDVDLDRAYVEFHHRPDSGTPLKNKRKGERPVGIPDKTVEAVRLYLDQHRESVVDEYDRQPLLASIQGRPREDTIRDWSYLATQPCLQSPCPHGRDRDTCEYVRQIKASKCPSSRSPHQIRTGSITYQLNTGLPPAVVAERVNAQIKTIEQHYDFASTEERWRRYRDRMEQRREFVDLLDESEDQQ